MPELDELLRRWTDSAEAVSPAEARRRAEGRDPDAGSGRPARRTLLLAVAAITVLAGVAGALVLRVADDDRVDTTPATTPTTDAPSPTVTGPVATTTTTTTPDDGQPTTTIAPLGATAIPVRWIGRSVDGRLVAVDTASGGEQTLAAFDDPRVASSEPVAGGSFLGMVDLSPDAATVYYEACCEPAVGQIFRVAATGGQPELVTSGSHPAVSPDGTKLAVVELQTLKVRDLATGTETRYEAAALPAMLGQPAWSPDGRSIALERYDADVRVGRVVVLDLERDTDLDAAREVVGADADGTPRLPTFDAAGRLHVVRQGVDQEGGPLGPARVEVHRPAGGEISRRALDQPLRAQHHDPSGAFVIRALADGTVEITDSAGTPRRAATGFDEVAW